MGNKFKNKIIYLYYKSQFSPNFLSIFINPNFIVRTGLFDGIKRYSSNFRGRILDFGCGRKPYAEIFENCNEYIGLDIQLEEKFNQHLYADVYYDGVIIPFENKSFDNIVSFDVLQLIENPDNILIELKRVLKDEGNILITVPFVWMEHWDSYDLYRYTVSGVEKILVKNGFSIVAKTKTTTHLETILQMFIAYLTYELFPVNKRIKLLFVVIFITPLNLIGLLLRKFKSVNSSPFYNNALILAKKNI